MSSKVQNEKYCDDSVEQRSFRHQLQLHLFAQWCLARAHKALEIDSLLEKLTHLSGLKGQRASGGSTPPF